jgi:hypothetical protein
MANQNEKYNVPFCSTWRQIVRSLNFSDEIMSLMKLLEEVEFPDLKEGKKEKLGPLLKDVNTWDWINKKEWIDAQERIELEFLLNRQEVKDAIAEILKGIKCKLKNKRKQENLSLVGEGTEFSIKSARKWLELLFKFRYFPKSMVAFIIEAIMEEANRQVNELMENPQS